MGENTPQHISKYCHLLTSNMYMYTPNSRFSHTRGRVRVWSLRNLYLYVLYCIIYDISDQPLMHNTVPSRLWLIKKLSLYPLYHRYCDLQNGVKEQIVFWCMCSLDTKNIGQVSLLSFVVKITDYLLSKQCLWFVKQAVMGLLTCMSTSSDFLS